jgi:exoribonuclease-2
MKDGLVRADTLPLVLRAIGAEQMPRGARVRVRLGEPDLLTLDVGGSVLTRLDDPTRSDNDAVVEDDPEESADAAPTGLSLAIDVQDADPASEATAPVPSAS